VDTDTEKERSGRDQNVRVISWICMIIHVCMCEM